MTTTSFAQQTVAAVLLDLGAQAATGVLTLARGQVHKQLFLRRGVLVAADSNLREEALGEILVSLGLLGKSRLPMVLAEMRKRGQKMGAVLVDMGLLSADDVLAALGEQVRRRAYASLRWDASESAFETSDSFVGGLIEHPFALGPLVLGGLRTNASYETLLPVLDEKTPRVIGLTPRFEQHREAFEATFGRLLLDQVAAGAPVQDVVVHPEASAMIEALDALLTTGLGRLEEQGRTVPLPAAPVPNTDFDVSPGSFSMPQPATKSDPLGAELAFNEGREALVRGDFGDALVHLEHAVVLRPDQAAYHAWLGATLFQVHGQGAMPEALDRLEHAVAVDPDSADAHAFLAGTLKALGDGQRARQHYEKSLTLRPAQPEIIETLRRLYLDAGQVSEAEWLYRRLLASLGERDRPLQRRLWTELADLFAGPLEDPASAARARGMATRLADS